MANAYGNLTGSNLRRRRDTDDDVPSNIEMGGVTYGDRVHIGPEGSTDPQTSSKAPETAENRESVVR